MPRNALPVSTKREVLMEAGYRCAVPTCRGILALDLHHIIEVSEGGGDDTSNLIALCPTCHALYTRGTITKDAISAWKTMLVGLSHAFDKDSISNLLFLQKSGSALRVSGDGVLKFSHLIASDLASFRLLMQNGPLFIYQVFLTDKGSRIIEAWFSGDRNQVNKALQGV